VVRLVPESRDFLLHQSIETDSGAYLVSHLVGPLFLGNATLLWP